MSKEVTARRATIVRYAKSTLITFLSGFLPVLYIQLGEVDSLESITPALFLGAVLAGVRFVLKGLMEKIEGRI